ncbi:MAG TPA: 2-dehydro-3-deoxy-6-phosphogalactonate aldolase [Castellaniella sp.]|uniref:2-dehydro-3-deoxy-6-phosphogalactonate aldolase n=1 Tax=Castellaniella sp. TaxID=1955812 RepID=UPI002F090C95
MTDGSGFDLTPYLGGFPLIAILRGVTLAQVDPVAGILLGRGWRVIEIPLNSPDALQSIAKLSAAHGSHALVGAGTVMTPDQVREVRQAGGRLIVMPHSDPDVIGEARVCGMACIPGVATPTEAFAALRAGADALKLFPAEQLGPSVVKAWRAVMPKRIGLMPVGGITPDSMGAYLRAGASGFGLGGGLFKPQMTLDEVAHRAGQYVGAWQALAPEMNSRNS